MSKKRCVCGRSQLYPLCDNSHEAEDWSCRQKSDWAAYGFSASPALMNYAHKLSAEFQAVLCDEPHASYRFQHWVAIVESSQIQTVLELAEHVQAQKKSVLVIGAGAERLAPCFPDAQIYELPSDLPWGRLKAFLKDEDTALSPVQARAAAKKFFISHAVSDEALMQPALVQLKQYYGLDIFSCQDSIADGRIWHDEIIEALKQADRVVALISQAMRNSTFCAFELGYALANQSPLSLISLDGSPPPSYIQHLQMHDLKREAQIRPWLNRSELLTEQLLALSLQ